MKITLIPKRGGETIVIELAVKLISPASAVDKFKDGLAKAESLATILSPYRVLITDI